MTREICRLIVGLVLLSSALSPLPADERAIEFVREEGKLAIRAGDSPVAVYVFRDAEIPRPYFAHLHAPDGIQVSRRHPPKEGEDATDHALMHPGLWLAFGDLSGCDSWRLKAPVEFVEFTEEPAVVDGVGRFAVRLRYLSEKSEPIAQEVCRHSVAVVDHGYLLACDSRIEPVGEKIVFGDQEEMGLGVRLASGLTVKAGGKLLNSRGQVNEKEVWGQTADWCDYQGVLGEVMAGMLIAPDPANFRPSWFHARDYGVLVANPFGRHAFGAGEPSRIEVSRGEALRLRFAVLLHSGPGEARFDAAEAYREIIGTWK